jgi:hypothetical protein
MKELCCILTSIVDGGISISSGPSSTNMSPEMAILIAVGFVAVAISFAISFKDI